MSAPEKAYDHQLQCEFTPSNDARGCDYQGYEFGAHYPDSVCIDGYLWDADSGDADGDGWVYTSGGEDPCPWCNHEAWAERAEEKCEDYGYNDSERFADLKFDRFEHLTERFSAAFQRGKDKAAKEEAALAKAGQS